MFRYEYPEFKNKQLLKADMLELLRDYPRHYTRLLYQGFGNGIVNGCELSWNDSWLTVNSGLIYWNGNLYYMDQPYRLECGAKDQQRYLVVKFMNENKQSNKISGETSIYLSKEPVRMQDQMELCRFRLQEGSRLRSIYKDFRDYSTEYDTINIIHAPYAGVMGNNINPSILMRFAEEMMETEMADTFDISFVMNVLANDGRISRKAVNQYLKKSCGKDIVPDKNVDIYQELLNELANRKRQGKSRENNGKIQRKVMLI